MSTALGSIANEASITTDDYSGGDNEPDVTETTLDTNTTTLGVQTKIPIAARPQNSDIMPPISTLPHGEHRMDGYEAFEDDRNSDAETTDHTDDSDDDHKDDTEDDTIPNIPYNSVIEFDNTGVDDMFNKTDPSDLQQLQNSILEYVSELTQGRRDRAAILRDNLMRYADAIYKPPDSKQPDKYESGPTHSDGTHMTKPAFVRPSMDPNRIDDYDMYDVSRNVDMPADADEMRKSAKEYNTFMSKIRMVHPELNVAESDFKTPDGKFISAEAKIRYYGIIRRYISKIDSYVDAKLGESYSKDDYIAFMHRLGIDGINDIPSTKTDFEVLRSIVIRIHEIEYESNIKMFVKYGLVILLYVLNLIIERLGLSSYFTLKNFTSSPNFKQIVNTTTEMVIGYTESKATVLDKTVSKTTSFGISLFKNIATYGFMKARRHRYDDYSSDSDDEFILDTLADID